MEQLGKPTFARPGQRYANMGIARPGISSDWASSWHASFKPYAPTCLPFEFSADQIVGSEPPTLCERGFADLPNADVPKALYANEPFVPCSSPGPGDDESLLCWGPTLTEGGSHFIGNSG
jgi:hypothetical protein